MKNFEFETNIPKYTCTFLVEFSVENAEPVLESVTYDELPISVADMPAAVTKWLIEAARNYYRSAALTEFEVNITEMSKIDNIMGDGAKLFTGLNYDKAKGVVVCMQKQISENEPAMVTLIGEKLVDYFKTAQF